MKYLFVHEDGTVETGDRITADDVKAVREGILEVITVSKSQFFTLDDVCLENDERTWWQIKKREYPNEG